MLPMMKLTSLGLALMTLAAVIGLTFMEGPADAHFQQGKTNPQAKKAAEDAKKAAKEELRIEESEAIKSVYILLASANHDYHGHRAAAMKSVESIGKRLDANLFKQDSVTAKIKAAQDRNAVILAKIKTKEDSDVHEKQAISDLQLLQASAKLATISTTAALNKQAEIQKHADHAISEINIALTKVAKAEIKGQESQVLTQAYIFLTAAKHDYNGHRAKAQSEVEQAINMLDATVLKDDVIQDKITAISNAAVQTKEKATKSEAVQIDQTLSDLEVHQAGVMIQDAITSLKKVESTDSEVVKKAQGALKEVELALKTRR